MKNEKQPGFRHELKFLISEAEREVIGRVLSAVLLRDAHGGSYQIRSLYFDDMWQSAYHEKLAGVEARKKYRIRFYDHSDACIRLERKEKEGAYIRKCSESLTRQETERILAGDVCFLRERKGRLCREFYVDYVTGQMRPAVIVDYDREPFVYPWGDVRITFDRHVRAGMYECGLFEPGIVAAEVFTCGQLLMEVKYTEFLPEFIRDLLPVREGARVAFSKYTLCLEKRRISAGRPVE